MRNPFPTDLAPGLVRGLISGLILAATPLAAHEYRAGDILIDHPFAYATPPGAKAGGGYMTVTNDGEAPDRLIGVRADVPRVSLHETREAGGIARMLPVDSVEIPPGRDVTFEQGGLHVMFMGLEAPLEEGDEVPTTLIFERAGEIEVIFAIEAREGAGDHADHGGTEMPDDAPEATR